MRNTLLQFLAGCLLLAIGANGQTKPVAVQEVDVTAKRAFQLSYSMPNLKGGTNVVATVPPTRRWVIEQVGLHCYTASGYLIYRVNLQTTVMGAAVNHTIPLLPQGSGGGLQHYSALYPTKLYADGGTQLQLTGWSTHSEGGQCTASISGYWIELLALTF